MRTREMLVLVAVAICIVAPSGLVISLLYENFVEIRDAPPVCRRDEFGRNRECA